MHSKVKRILHFWIHSLNYYSFISSASYSGNYIMLVKEWWLHLLRQSNFCQVKYYFLNKKPFPTWTDKVFILVVLFDLETIGRLCVSSLCHRFMSQKQYRVETEIIITKLYENQWIHLYSKWRLYKTFTVLLHWSSNTNSER